MMPITFPNFTDGSDLSQTASQEPEHARILHRVSPMRHIKLQQPPRFSRFPVECVAIEQPNHMAVDMLAHIAHGLRSGHPRLQRRNTGRCKKRTGHHAQRPGSCQRNTDRITATKGNDSKELKKTSEICSYITVAMHACDRTRSSGRIVFCWLNKLI